MAVKQGWQPADMPCSLGGYIIVDAEGKEIARYSEEQWARKLLNERLDRMEAKLDQLLLGEDKH